MKKITWTELAAIAIVVIASITAFSSLHEGLPGDFLLDDHARIKNSEVTEPSATAILRAVIKTDSGTFGRIIPLVTLYATKAISGNDPELFKLQNIGLHLITGLLIFWFIGKLLQSERFRNHLPENLPWIVAATTSTLWLLHPIQVSTALYIVQRMTQMSTIFTLLALISYVNMRHVLNAGNTSTIPSWLCVALFSIAALLSKESASLIPLFILLIEYIGFGFSTRTHKGQRQLLAGLFIFSIFPLVAGFSYFLTHTDILLHDYVMRPFSLGERIATEAIVMWKYMGMLLTPRLSSMSLYHDGISIHGLTSMWSILSIFAWILAVIILFILRTRYPIIIFGFAFFLISHTLESTILPLELMFEHRNYIGSMGIMLSVSMMLVKLSMHFPALRSISIVTFLAITVGLGTMQVARSSMWADPYTFSVISAKEQPESARAVSMLANLQAQRGHLEEARGLIRMSIENQNHDAAVPGLLLHLVLFNCYEDEVSDELIERTRSAIEENVADTYVLIGLKVIRQRMDRDICPAIDLEQLYELEKAAANNPRTRKEYRFFFNSMAGLTSANLGNMDVAKEFLEHASEYAHSVSLMAQRNHSVTLANICLSLNDVDCVDSSLDKIKRINSRLEYFIGTDDELLKLESLKNELLDRQQ